MRLEELHMDWKAVAVIIVSTLTLTVAHYHRVFRHRAYDQLFFYLVVPLLTILLLFRESPAEYGFRLGDWKAGLLLTAAGCGVMGFIIFYLARTPHFRGYYALRAKTAMPMPLANALELFAWEFLFRGFLLFSLYRVCGPYAILIQAMPFAVAHFGKPEIETLSCIFGGSLLGYVAWRTRSFLYPFVIHWFMATWMILVAGGAAK
jgi:uncharacterized protein